MAETPKSLSIDVNAVITIPEPATFEIRLSEEARSALLERVPWMFLDGPPLDTEWRELEECLTDLFIPRRWITGIDPELP